MCGLKLEKITHTHTHILCKSYANIRNTFNYKHYFAKKRAHINVYAFNMAIKPHSKVLTLEPEMEAQLKQFQIATINCIHRVVSITLK